MLSCCRCVSHPCLPQVRLEIEKREMAEKEAEERVERLKNDNEVTIALLVSALPGCLPGPTAPERNPSFPTPCCHSLCQRSLQHIASDSLKVSSRFHRQAGSSRVEVEHLRAQMTSSLRCLPSKGDFERAWEYDTSAILRWNDGEEFVPGALLNLAADIDRAKNLLTVSVNLPHAAAPPAPMLLVVCCVWQGALNDAAAVEVEDTEAHRVQVRKMEALFDQVSLAVRTQHLKQAHECLLWPFADQHPGSHAVEGSRHQHQCLWRGAT